MWGINPKPSHLGYLGGKLRQRKLVRGPLDMIGEGCITETVCIEVSYNHS